MDGPRLTGLIVLVLEDEPLVSLDVVDALKSAGAGVRAAATVDRGFATGRQPARARAVIWGFLSADDPTSQYLTPWGVRVRPPAQISSG